MKYRKLMVAIIGAVLVGLNTFFDVDVQFGAEGVADVIITLLTAFGVWAVPNEGEVPAA